MSSIKISTNLIHQGGTCTVYNYGHVIAYTGNRDSTVGIATHYGLDGPGFENRLGRNFSVRY